MNKPMKHDGGMYVSGTEFDTDGTGYVCLILADIVDFSSISQAIEDRENDAAEKLTRILRGLFSRIAEHVAQIGGRVLSFGGDSVLIGWHVDSNESLLKIVSNALQVCENIHLLCVDVSAKTQLDLKMRVSLSNDEASWITINKKIGGTDCVVWGAAMLKLIELNRTCIPGKTKAEIPDASALGANGQRMHDYIDAIRDQIDKRLSQQSLGLLDSRQAVTVVFVRFAEEAVSHHITHQSLRDLSTKLFKCAQTHGGLVCRVRMDDKGLNALVLWGVRHHSYEDDANRALSFAHQTLPQYFSKLRIGMTSGTVFTGYIDEERSVEFTAMGSVVNNAADLSSYAPVGKLFCDKMTQTRLGKHQKWMRHPLKLKGMLHAADFYLLPQSSEAAYEFQNIESEIPSQNSNVISLEKARSLSRRDFEIESIQRQLCDHGSVLVVAEAGMGKTFLCNAIVRDWLDDNEQVIRFRFVTDSGQTALRSILDEMEIWAIQRSASLYKSEFEIWSEIGINYCNLSIRDIESIDRVIHRRPHKNEDDFGINALVLQEKIELLIQSWIVQISNTGKLLICMDDVHWIDATSAGLIARIIHQIPSVFWLGTSRHQVSSFPQDLELRPIEWRAQVDLLPFGADEVLLLLKNKFPRIQIDDEVLSDILKITKGNALFVAHWIEEALQRNRYRIAAERLVKTDDRPTQLQRFEDPPISLHFLLQSQFDRLNEEQRSLAQFVSVLNQAVSKKRLLHFLNPVGVRESTVEQCLEMKILNKYSLDKINDFIVFHHALMRDVAYSSLSMAQRTKLHNDIAIGLDTGQLFPSDPLSRGWHWMRSNSSKTSLLKVIDAGKFAITIHSIPQAIDFLSFAIGQSKELAETLNAQEIQQLGLLLAFAQSELGKNQADRELLLRASRSKYSDKATWHQLAIMASRHIAHIVHSYFEKPQKNVNAPSLSMHATAQLLLAEISYFQGDINALQWHAVCSLDASEQSQSLRELSATYGGISLVCARFGLMWLSNRYAAAALRVSRRALDKVSTVDAVAYICLRGIAMADWRNTHRRIIQVLERNQKFGNSRRRNELLIIHGYMLEFKGNLSEAFLRYQECWRAGVQRNDYQTAIWGQLGCSRVHLQRCEFSHVMHLINEIEDTPRMDNLSRLELAAQRMILAIIQGRDAQLDELLMRWPLDHLSKFAQISFAYQGFLTSFWFAVMFKRSSAPFAEDQEKWRQAEKSVRAALKLHAAQFPACRPVREFMEGVWCANQFKSHSALKHLQQSKSLANTMGMQLFSEQINGFEAFLLNTRCKNIGSGYLMVVAQMLLER